MFVEELVAHETTLPESAHEPMTADDEDERGEPRCGMSTDGCLVPAGEVALSVDHIRPLSSWRKTSEGMTGVERAVPTSH